MDHAALLALLMACAPQVDTHTAGALVAIESAGNPHAIGVVGGALVRQPTSRAEALSTALALQAQGWNFSVGLAQINLYNLPRLGLSLGDAFDPCINLAAMQVILRECFERATAHGNSQQRQLRQSLSCYYSGNFATGFRHGYVQRVVRAAASSDEPAKGMPR